MTAHEHPDRTMLEHLGGLWANRHRDPRRTPAMLMVSFSDGELLMAFARPEQADDNSSDPITEIGGLATAALAGRHARQATMLLPIRMRDLDRNRVIATSLCLTSLIRDQGAVTMRASMTPWEQLGDRVLVAPVTQSVAIDDSPVASMLWDAQHAVAPGGLLPAIHAARVLGMDVIFTGEPADPGSNPAGADRARQRLRRLARELKKRHDPQAPHHVGRRVRSAVPIGLPDGMQAACLL